MVSSKKSVAVRPNNSTTLRITITIIKLYMPRDYRYRINMRDIDFTRCASLTTMCDYVIQAASEDATATGAGVEYLYSQSLAWVLMRMSLNIERYPAQLESFTISTWVESIDKLMVRRNMIIRGENGDVIGYAITYWCIINFETRTSQDCRTFPHFFQQIEPVGCALSSPERIRTFEGELSSTQTVRYSHIDFNGHTNTTKYIVWMLNSLDINFLRQHEPQRIDINFLHESRYSDKVSIVKREESGSTLFSLTNQDTSNAVCTAKIRWREHL